MISNLGSLHYEERLAKLGMQSLEERRRRGDQIQCFKTVNGYGDIDPNAWFRFVRDRHDVDTRNHEADNMVLEKCRLNVRKNFFVNRIVKDWNDLPMEVRRASSINSFKNQYDAIHLK